MAVSVVEDFNDAESLRRELEVANETAAETGKH